MRNVKPERLNRRLAIRRIATATGALSLGLGFVAGRSAGAQSELLTVSGGGVNVKKMPTPDGSTVELREGFSFDAHYAQCIIEDNPSALAMDTFAMGRVVIEPHQFYMGMFSHDMTIFSIERRADGKLAARLTGQLSCSTYAGTATLALGSRTEIEVATFAIEAVDGGPGGGAAGDSFAFSVAFNRDTAPVNYAIFGPSPTFTGEMVAGEVTIAAPVVRSLQA